MDNYKKVNVAEEDKDEDSLLNLYRKLIKLRNGEPALHIGTFLPVIAEGNMLSYMREYSGKKFIIALNLGASEEKCTPKLQSWKGKVRVATHKELQGKEIREIIYLGPNQGVVVEIISEETT